MSNLNPAANPAKFPRATSAKTTEYDDGSEGNSDFSPCDDCHHYIGFDCRDCEHNKEGGFFVPLVTEPANQVEAGVTKSATGPFAARDLNRCDDCGHPLLTDSEDYLYCPICYRPELVTEPAGQVEPGVTKEDDPCISPPQFVDLLASQQKINRPYQTMHFFHSWDEIDRDITRLVNDFKIHKVWDIFAWRFLGSNHWFDDLCYIPQDLCIEVRWGCVNV